MGKVLLLACLCACGRFGFSATEAPDAAADSAPDAPPSKLACGQPTRFQMGAVGSLAVAATPWGFGAFTTDASNVVHTWEWSFVGETLTMTTQNATLAPGANGTLGAAALGDNILVAEATATETIVYAIDSRGEAVAQPVHRAELAVTAPVAASGSGAGVALATISAGQVTGHVLDASGGDAIAPVTIVPASPAPDTIELSTAETGYAAVWGEPNSGKHAIVMALYDANLATVAGPVVVDDLGYDAYHGNAVYAASSNEYLVTWHEKNAANGDDVWFTILDASLAVAVPPMLVGTSAHDAVAATDGTNFWIVWDVYAGSTAPAYLAGASVSATGVVAPRPVTSSGGTPAHWAMTARDGQPVLAWTEVGGSGPDLYFDPMCSQ